MSTNTSNKQNSDLSSERDQDVYMATARGMPNIPDIRMATTKAGLTCKNDIHMETVRGGSTVKQGGFQLWERELLDSAEVKRKATVAQLCKCRFDRIDTLALGWRVC